MIQRMLMLHKLVLLHQKQDKSKYGSIMATFGMIFAAAALK